MTPLERIARFERDLVVQAGAGTNKTHALVTVAVRPRKGACDRCRTESACRVARRNLDEDEV